MKKINIFLSLILLVVVLVSCGEETENFDNVGGVSMTAFNKAGSKIVVSPNPDVIVVDSVQVDVTTVSNVDRVMTVTIDPSSTVLPAMYDMVVTPIKAGAYNGYVVLKGNYAAFPNTQKYRLQLNLVSVDGATLTSDLSLKSHSVILNK